MMPLSQSKKSDCDSSPAGQTAAGSYPNGQETGLAQHIWKRHDHASGFTIRRFQMAFARRHPLASNLPLPLLGAVQKRWGSAEGSPSGRPAVSAYAWRRGSADFPDTASGPESIHFKSQPGGDDPAGKERVRPTGEKNAATARPNAMKTSPGAESSDLQAPIPPQGIKPPPEAGIIRRVVPTISAAEKVRTTDPLQTGVIDQQGREQPGAGQLSNFKRGHTYDLPVAASAKPRTGRMEAPILQRRKKPAVRHDSKLAAALQPQGQRQDNRTAGTGSQSDVRVSAKMSPAMGILRPASGKPGTTIIQRFRHQPGIQSKLSAAGQDNRQRVRGHLSGRPSSTDKGNDPGAVQKKIFGNTDNAEVSFLPATLKTKTDSRQQNPNHAAGRHVLAPVNGVGGAHADGSGTVSGGSGLMASSTDATLLTSKDPAEENRRPFAIKTEAGDGLAADILQRHRRMPVAGFIGAKTEQTRMPLAPDGKLTPGTDRKRGSAQAVSENTVSRGSGIRPSGQASRSIAESIASISFGYLHPTVTAMHPHRIIQGDTRQIGLSPLSASSARSHARGGKFENEMISATDKHSVDHAAVPSLGQADPTVTAFGENRALPQMMIHRTFATAGLAASGSNPTEYTANTFLRRTVDRPPATLGESPLGFDAMNMIPQAGRFAPSTAGDPASRPLVQLSASERPIFRGGRSMPSSAVQSGTAFEAESRPLEPRAGSSGNEAAGPVELEQLVEKVLHKLIRRIAIERERRGLQRWP